MADVVRILCEGEEEATSSVVSSVVSVCFCCLMIVVVSLRGVVPVVRPV